jgi:hypothetical protein
MIWAIAHDQASFAAAGWAETRPALSPAARHCACRYRSVFVLSERSLVRFRGTLGSASPSTARTTGSLQEGNDCSKCPPATLKKKHAKGVFKRLRKVKLWRGYGSKNSFYRRADEGVVARRLQQGTSLGPSCGKGNRPAGNLANSRHFLVTICRCRPSTGIATGMKSPASYHGAGLVGLERVSPGPVRQPR